MKKKEPASSIPPGFVDLSDEPGVPEGVREEYRRLKEEWNGEKARSRMSDNWLIVVRDPSAQDAGWPWRFVTENGYRRAAQLPVDSVAPVMTCDVDEAYRYPDKGAADAHAGWVAANASGDPHSADVARSVPGDLILFKRDDLTQCCIFLHGYNPAEETIERWEVSGEGQIARDLEARLVESPKDVWLKDGSQPKDPGKHMESIDAAVAKLQEDHPRLKIVRRVGR